MLYAIEVAYDKITFLFSNYLDNAPRFFFSVLRNPRLKVTIIKSAGSVRCSEENDFR